ncbi:MAG: FKBP-type peptidyl-prolyl cis-trans isomerase [Odoribacteraceae bacterium]|jgi:hypothetical protein|nr:FKBP-type peptidyl-prolyl cis-trans isomerase [Odoribacteraceae bacterium]
MKRSLTLGACVLLLAACSGEEQEKTLVDIIEQENAEIRAFLAGLGGATVTPVPYLSKKGQVIDCTYIFNNTPPPAGSALQEGDFVLYDYSIQRLDGSYIESTDPAIRADTFRYAVLGPIYHRMDTSKHYDYVGGALSRVAEGARGEMIVPSILRDKSGIPFHYTLKSHRVIHDLFAYEKTLIQNFIDATTVTVARYQDGNADTLVHTLVYNAGAGTRQIQPTDTVTLYRACYVLDEITPLREAFSLDTLVTNAFDPARQELPALGEALAHLREGDEANIVIPYLLAFKEKPGYHPADTRRVIPWIPPYATLVYAIKVAKVREKQQT